VLHTGYYPTIYFPQWHVQQSVRFWERFMADKPEDFRLYIENVFDPGPDTLVEILDQLGDPRVMACLDVGHAAAVGSDPLDWIRTLGPRIGHFHLHNNDGTGDTHNPVTEGVIDMKKVLQVTDDYCPPDASLTVESRDAEESVVWLKAQ
jgi:sugar phosphate isomerase/epimerase